MNNERYGRAIAIVGLQFGSEGKGAISAYLSPIASASIRIGASNAGHTLIHKNKSYVMRQIPCGWVSPHTKLVIGISALISLPVLRNEIRMLEKVTTVHNRLYIDPHAHVITDDQIRREQETDLSGRIGSTSATSGLGIGAALADKVLRAPTCVRAKDVAELHPYIADTVELLNTELARDEIIIFEGTQGFGLSINHGYFPYTTSSDTTAPSLFAGTGVNPYGFTVETIGVARTYPIRVGGPSGPFDPDSRELSWKEIALRSGSKKDITEHTSVTKKVRRVATFSFEGLKRACMVNNPTEIALTFADHIDHGIYERDMLTTKVEDFIEKIEHSCNVPVQLLKTGPKTTIDFDSYRASIIRKIS